MASVELRGVSKRFDDVAAVVDLDLEISDGEFVVLLGPSGCGKSTALRMVAGLTDPDTGDVLIDGRSVVGVAAKDRNLAMVFQSYALYPHMTVAKNIAFGLKPLKLSRADRDAGVAEAARMLGLTGLLGRKPAQLSGGQRQRVALARAVVRRPQAFLMDEPLSNLDARLRTDMRAELVDLHVRTGTTTVYVTHDQVEAMTMADRIAVMRDGHLQQVGTPGDVYRRPANVFVARFVGTPSMNVLRGEVTDAGVSVAGVEVTGVRPARATGTSVDVGIRPDEIAVGAEGLPATVDRTEDLGHERLVFATSSSGDPVVVRLDGHAICPAPGDATHLDVDGSALHLFDVSTGARIEAAGP
ncbi:MAG: ABC transporter ATP-binding protein [Acidimicrobiales bacterium]